MQKRRPLTTKPPAGFAPAKINLTLHVTGRRDDGYHLLDSLVVFASVGDVLSLEPGRQTNLFVSGPEAAGVPTGPSNSILQAATRFLPEGTNALFRLEKHLPSAAGIGGGTADAAAALRLIHETWPDGPTERLFPSDTLAHLQQAEISAVMAQVAPLGADVPVCLYSQSARMRGIGEDVQAILDLPTLYAVLVNPRVEVVTGAVFKAMEQTSNREMDTLPAKPSPDAFVDWLSRQRNDMEPPALEIAPDIGTALAALRGSDDCMLARMSGSGATCFGLYPTEQAAQAAASALEAQHKDWWVKPCLLG